MKQNELTIEIPNGKIVNWEESKKQNKIVLKDKQLTYNDIINNIIEKHQYEYISPNGELFLTRHIHKCLKAKNKLTTVAKYLNDGWKPSRNCNGHFDAWVIYATPNKSYIGIVKIIDCAHNNNVLFRSRELAQQAIEILGEETVKLALEPLGI